MNNQCGFLLELDSLSAGWGGQNIWCSFDRAGLWRIPQNEDLYVPAEGSDVTANLVKNSDSSALAAISYPDQIELAPQELQEHWSALEDFRLFLDNLEQELNHRDRLRAQQAVVRSSFTGWIGRLLRPGR